MWQKPATRRRRVHSSEVLLPVWGLTAAIGLPFCDGGFQRKRAGRKMAGSGDVGAGEGRPLLTPDGGGGGGWWRGENGGYATFPSFLVLSYRGGFERMLKTEGIEEEEDCAECAAEDLWRAARLPELGATQG